MGNITTMQHCTPQGIVNAMEFACDGNVSLSESRGQTDDKPRAISSSGAASAEAKLVWIMSSRDRARRSQACLNIAEVRTDGAASAEPSPGLSYAESRQRKTKSRRKTKSACLDYAES